MIKKRKGFIISELIFGLIFLMIFILVNVSMYINSYKNIIESKRFLRANNLLIREVEEIQNMNYEDITTEEIDSRDTTVGKFTINAEYLGEVENTSRFYTRSDLQTESDSDTDAETGITTTTTTQYYIYTYYSNTNSFSVTNSGESNETIIVDNIDIAKLIKVNISYQINGQEETYSITTLKVMPTSNIVNTRKTHRENISVTTTTTP